MTKKEVTTRYYAVSDKKTGDIIALVGAASVAQARSHHARKMFEVRHASQTDVMAAMKAGVEPEAAGVEEEVAAE